MLNFLIFFQHLKKTLKISLYDFQKFESINTVMKFKGLVNWVWIDTFTKLPLNQNSINILKHFKTCLVCPERWNRQEDITLYKEKLQKINFSLNAVMTSRDTFNKWL